MKSTVEPLEGNKVKLRVEVDEAEFDQAIDAAFKKIAREVRIPGFRPGKAPRKVLEARLGKGIGRTQAIEDALPGYYVEAIKEHEVDVIAAPEIDITGGREDGAIEFDVVVEVRPEITVPGYQNLRVTVESPAPTDEEVDAQIDRLQQKLAELEPVDRPAVDSDVATIDIAGSQAGEELSGLTTDDYSYEVGSGMILPEVDEQLRGAKVGDILKFEVAPPGAAEADGDEGGFDSPAPIEFRILVKDIQAKVLPERDDEFASAASEFDTYDELREDTLRRITVIKKMQGSMALRENVSAALADLVEVDIPEPLIDQEMRQRVQELAMRLGAQGMELGQWLEMTGKSQADLVQELRAPAEMGARVDLALRAIAEAQGIDCSDDEIDAELDGMAKQVGAKAKELLRRLEREGDMQAVRSDIRKRKALEWLVDRVEIVDPDGKALDRSLFQLTDGSGDTGSTAPEVAGEIDTPDATEHDEPDDSHDDHQDDDAVAESSEGAGSAASGDAQADG